MVLFGIWLIDSTSGLPLAYTTTPGFNINADLFSGFITASHDFAHEASGGTLETIALGNFKLIIRRSPLALKVLAVGANDPETRYLRFFQDLEERISPILVPVHKRPEGLSGVPGSLRKRLEEVISIELEAFSTRKAPSDLSELSVLSEEPARLLLQALIERKGVQLVPEPSTTGECYSYPLAESITGLSDEETVKLLDRLAEYGLLLTEPMDTSLSCPNCSSLNLHPRLLCPSCKTPAQPVSLYEHLTCGHIGIRPPDGEQLKCSICKDTKYSAQEFRLFLGFQCSSCNSFFKTPSLIFVCHSCRESLEPEKASVKVLSKYLLNPALVSELDTLLKASRPSGGIMARLKAKLSATSQTEPSDEDESPITPEKPIEVMEREEPSVVTVTPERIISEEKIEASSPVHSTASSTIGDDEAAILQELEELDKALKNNKISEGEYDRSFVRLRLKLRVLRTQSADGK
ncbi:MAG: hypothetical protein ACFFDP_08025 [Promethearchaeota archaeon]